MPVKGCQMCKDIRWKQRFGNLDRAYTLLRSALEEKRPDQLSDLEQEGVILRFEYTYELAWKTMKDYLEENGVVLEEITPRSVIKEAFAARIIPDGQVWIDCCFTETCCPTPMIPTYSKQCSKVYTHTIYPPWGSSTSGSGKGKIIHERSRPYNNHPVSRNNLLPQVSVPWLGAG